MSCIWILIEKKPKYILLDFAQEILKFAVKIKNKRPAILYGSNKWTNRPSIPLHKSPLLALNIYVYNEFKLLWVCAIQLKQT